MSQPNSYQVIQYTTNGTVDWIVPEGNNPDNTFTITIGNMAAKDLSAHTTPKGYFTYSLVKATGDATVKVAKPLNTSNRNEVFSDFLHLISYIDDQKTDLNTGVVQQLVARIAEQLPMPLDEIPMYSAGMVSMNGPATTSFSYLDLKPGTRLKIGLSNFNHPSGSNSAPSMYTNTGELHLLAQSNASGQLQFNTYLNGAAYTPPAGQTSSNTTIVAGLLDLNGSYDYCRIYYPANGNPNPSHPENDVDGAVVIAHASTYSTLPAATNNLSETNSLSFYGRAAIIPEIGIWWNQQLHYVEVSTTLRQLLESEYDLLHVPSSLSIKRNINGSLSPVLPVAPASIIDMPLVQGDQITWQNN